MSNRQNRKSGKNRRQQTPKKSNKQATNKNKSYNYDKKRGQ